MPNKTVLILGDSGDDERSFYLEQARANNHGLLHIHGNREYIMPSRDPIDFARTLRKFIDEEVKPLEDRYNIYFSCLGTKAQTVGAFLTLQSYPSIQVLDSLPSRRRIASSGKRKTLFADLGPSGLLNNIVGPS